MAESNKFGNPRTEFGDTRSGGQSDNTHCAQCETMLADALDGTLSAADQALFDAHMLICGPCAQLLADARRGHAWLEMLRDPQPEPPEALVDRILAQTSGLPTQASALSPAAAPGLAIGGGAVLPFRQRLWDAVRHSGLGQIALQPRLAMTAAMAFFSVALTMDLTGMQLKDLNPANLRPSTIRRTYSASKARVARYYDGIRVVYELESRLHQMENVNGADNATPAPQTAPARQPQPSDDQKPPEKKGSSTRPLPSAPIYRDHPGARMSWARYVPGHIEIADLRRASSVMNSSTGPQGTVREEGRFV